MIATMSSSQIQTMFPISTRTENQAGSPLPGIPRRMSSGSRTTSLQNTPIMTPKVTVQAPSPPTVRPKRTIEQARDEEDSSSSSSSSADWPTIVTRRHHRVRGAQLAATLCPSEYSTPVPALTKYRAVTPTAASNTVKNTAATTAAATVASQHIGKRLLFPYDADETPKASPVTPVSPPTSRQEFGRSISTSAIVDHHHHSHTRASTISFSSTDQVTKLILRKNGEPLKSSLKSTARNPRGSLAIVLDPSVPNISSKSEPNTPSLKNVHFDEQLERVKLFLAEQKPLAVSRDGSPTATDGDETSGTENDFPAWIYGRRSSSPKAASGGRLVMHLSNMPSSQMEDQRPDVLLRSLVLSPDAQTIVGRVRVRNLSFRKFVTARFTLDDWQTTSEVSGAYVESFSPEFDVFGFTIKLGGLLAKVEGRRMFVAIKYMADGRPQEMWDNNQGKNYHATFEVVKPKPSASPAAVSKSQPLMAALPRLERRRVVLDDPASSGASDVGEDLKNKLEQVVRAAALPSMEDQQSTMPTFKSTESFASRYDFASSLKVPWNRSISPSPSPPHTRAMSFPMHAGSGALSTSTSISPSPSGSGMKSNVFPVGSNTPPRRGFGSAQPLGSPRDWEGVAQFRPMNGSTDDNSELPFPVLPPLSADKRSSDGSLTRRRNHQRGYFDIDFTPLNETADGVEASQSNAGFALGIRSPGGRIRSMDDLVVASPVSTPRLSVQPSPSATGGVVLASNVKSQSIYHSGNNNSLSLPLGRLAVKSGMGVNTLGLGVGISMNKLGGYGGSDESAESTPSIASPCSTVSSSDDEEEVFPVPSPVHDVAGIVDADESGRVASNAATSNSGPNKGDYRTLLDRFCFFTGTEPVLGLSSHQRTHSSSSVEELLSTSSSSSPVYTAAMSSSSSLDTVTCGSGSSTPTCGRTPLVA